MGRSVKKRIKKEVVEVKIDEEQLDFMRYLGEDFVLPGSDQKSEKEEIE